MSLLSALHMLLLFCFFLFCRRKSEFLFHALPPTLPVQIFLYAAVLAVSEPLSTKCAQNKPIKPQAVIFKHSYLKLFTAAATQLLGFCT